MWFNSQASFSFIHRFDNPSADSILEDSLANVKAQGPQFKLRNDPVFPATDLKPSEGIQLKQPLNLKSDVVFDPITQQYIFTNKIGKVDYRPSSSMSIKEFQKYELHRTVRNYWQSQANGGKSIDQRGFRPSFNFGGQAFDKIFGSNTINIVPTGQAELIFKVDINSNNNPSIPENLRTVPSFDFEEKIQMNVAGTIGDRLKLGISYNTDATFDFENKTKLEYTGDEDEIIKKIEAGDVTMPLSGTLITGSQSLFGIKTDMQFGKLFVTTVLSEQKGQSQEIQTQGGAQVTDFEITSDEYEANKHFFLAHTFEAGYDQAHAFLPRIVSNIRITKIEVWVTNAKGNFQVFRDLYGFTDLGEITRDSLANPDNVHVFNYKYADNKANDLYNKILQPVSNLKTDPNALSRLGLIEVRDYAKLNSARLLTSTEYTLNETLGYISLNSALNASEILAVAYQYTEGGHVYQVGQFSTDNPDSKQPLVLKLIKGINLSPASKTWGLMMKNIYSLNAYDVSPDQFYLNIVYHDDRQGTDINYLPEDINGKNKLQFLTLFGLDQVNTQMQPQPDGIFDFIDQVTIDRKNGRIIFPMLQPFGRDGLNKNLNDHGITDPAIKGKYLYQELYDSTLTKARLVAQKNKFKLKGSYKATSTSDIFLNATNIPQGSVKVTSGGIQLQEGKDYTVDYTMGTVKILNQGYLNSGQPLKVSLENNSMFNVQTKTLIGTHLDYKFSDDFNIGATILHLNERPLTQKVNIGDEPISNTIWGLNSSFRTNSQLLTTLIDKLPLIQTKEPSSITLTGEFAQLIPGTSKAIGKNGVAYIDDFEGSETPLDLTLPNGWKLSSPPTNPLFPNNSSINNISSGFGRAKLSWYYIDPIFTTQISSLTPANIKNNPNLRSSCYVFQFNEQQLFPDQQAQYGQTNYLETMNLTYYPNLRGPYNYDLNVDKNDNLMFPENRWGGIMRSIPYTDFEASNIEYIEFWLMDPYIEDSLNTGGDLYFNLGEISEDVLKDGKMAFEQGLAASDQDSAQYEETVFGKVTTKQPVSRVFSTVTGALARQDVGLDGLPDDSEKIFFSSQNKKHPYPFMDVLQTILTHSADSAISADPSSDDFHYFKDAKFENSDIIDRYMDYNGMEKNSQGVDNTGQTAESYSTPDIEDLDDDNTMNETESFYEYKLPLIKSGKWSIGDNYITDKRQVKVTFPNNKTTTVNWYQFKIPIKDGKSVGGISGFESIRFMRMYLTGFPKKTTLRFARLELIRSEWRKYDGSLVQAGDGINVQPQSGEFDLQAVNIYENAGKKPVNYVLPPGISRVIDPSQEQLTQLNEQSMVLKVTNLNNGDARAVFKSVNFDMRQYKRLQMFAHCEALPGETLNNHDLSVFIRLGTDYTDNYYEYEVPMNVTNTSGGITVTDPNKIWDTANNFNIALELFQNIKLDRDNKGVPFQNIFKEFDNTNPKNTIRIRGNPSLSSIKSIMIGVRNPAGKVGGAKSAEIWVDELRLTDFSDKGGWAANARAQIKLADLGNVRVSGSIMTPGFGGIEKKINDREKVETTTFDVATDLELGKFFPEKAQVKIPMFASYSRTVINPEYDPYDPDIPLQVALDNAARHHASADSINTIKSNAQDFTERRSINFTNVKVNKMGKKPHFYDPANFSISYGYSDLFAHSPVIEYNKSNHYEGGFNYIYNTRPKNYTPLKKIGFLNNKMLKIFSDFNFYLVPKSISFRTNMARDYSEIKLRDISNEGIQIAPTKERNFIWGRYYDVKYDLSRALSVDFSAASLNRIDEVKTLGSRNNPDSSQQNLAIWPQILHGGNPTDYNQTINVNYNVPINKLPLLDWTNLNARYSTYFEWQYEPPFKDANKNDSTRNLGNDIKNTRNIQLNATASLTTIYNKIGFLKDLQSKPNKKAKDKPTRTVTFVKNYTSLKAGESKSFSHKLGTSDVTVKAVDDKGGEVKGKLEVLSNNRVKFTPDRDAGNVTITVEGKIEIGLNPFVIIARTTGKLLTGIKSITARYTITDGTTLQGYYTGQTREPALFGSTINDGQIVPGVPFILGVQDTNIITRLSKYHSLTTDQNFASPAVFASNKNLVLQLSYEPFDGLKIELTANHSHSDNITQSYNNIHAYTNENGNIGFDQAPSTSGNFSMTIISLGSFDKLLQSNGYSSTAFNKFKANRDFIAGKLDNQASTGVYKVAYLADKSAHHDTSGFGLNSQQVLIPAFLATYGGYGVNSVPLDLIPNIKYMRPNWHITYDGLTSIPFVDNYFKTVTLSHAYVSNYSIGSYASVLDYDPSNYIRDEISGNFYPQYSVDVVSINEQFTPLVGVDMTWKNNLLTRFEYKKMRDLIFSLVRNSISETRSNEYVFGVGYRFEQVPLKFITLNGGTSNVKSDLNLRTDLSIKNNYTVLRDLDEYPSIISAIRTMSLSVTADYALSDKLTLNVFYKRELNDTYGSYLYTNTQIGFSIRFTLTQ